MREASEQIRISFLRLRRIPHSQSHFQPIDLLRYNCIAQNDNVKTHKQHSSQKSIKSSKFRIDSALE
jgi:hypothetical protein